MAAARTPKGRSRRAALVTAAGQVAAEAGLGAVTHRAVAARSRLPLASTTYYFADRADLVQAAAHRAGLLELDRARAAAGRPVRPGGPRALAGHLLDVVIGPDRFGDAARLAAYYERVLEAVRTPGLAAALARWQDAMLEIVASVLERHEAPVAPRTALALVDGVAVQAVTDGRVSRDDLVEALATALAGVTAGVRGGARARR